MKKRNIKDFVGGKGFYIILSLCFAVIIVSAGIITVSNTNEINQHKEDYAKENYTQESQAVIDKEDEPVTVGIIEEETVNIGAGSAKNFEASQNEMVTQNLQESTENLNIQTENIIDNITAKSEAVIEQVESEAVIEQIESTESIQLSSNEKEVIEAVKDTTPVVKEVFLSFDKDDKMQWPVTGQILMDYSVDHTIFDKTLEQYRINNSISIGADVGTPVKAAAGGTVINISNDTQKGYNVVLDHGNGWQTTYSQLEENVSVSKNEIVEAGDIIGGIAEPTKYSIALGGHLDFEVTKDGVSKDPKSLLTN